MSKLIATYRWWLAAVLVVVSGLSGLTGFRAFAQSSAPLFLAATRPAARPQNTDPTIVRSREVEIQVPLLTAARGAGATLDLNLFADAAMTATLDRVDSNSSGYVWVGHVEGVPLSTVSLSVEGTTVDGAIFLPDATYLVKPAGNGVSRIVEIDQSRFPREIEPLVPEEHPEVKPAPRTAAADAAADMQADNGSIINVLVLYTPSAAAAAGGTTAMTTLINNAIAIANTSYTNSSVSQRLRLAGAQQVAYTESGSNSTDLTSLTSGAGAFSGVASLRDSTRADLVSLLTDTPGSSTCGVAWLMTNLSAAFAPNGYSVVEQACAVGNLTFPHELGHNMGLRHDWYVDSGVTPASYAHGYVNSAARWRTIMAYNDRCAAQGFNCTRLPLWSNPWVTNGGAPTGVVGGTSTACTTFSLAGNCDADDHRLLNESGFFVSNFRQTVVGASLAVDFGSAYGLYHYTETSGSGSWAPLHSVSPAQTLRADIDANGVMDTVAVFTGFGTWAYMNNAGWAALHAFDATVVKAGDVNNNGAVDLVFNFTGYGVWIRYDSGSWAQLHPLAVTDLQAGDFDGNGLADLVAQFPTYGEYILYNATTWTFLHGAQAAGIVVGNMDSDTGRRSEIVINFPGAGIWTWTNNTSWVNLHPLNAVAMSMVDLDGNGADDVALSFSGYGLFIRRNNTSWTALHSVAPELLAGAR